jgi:uncharacterized protein YndB with AHSA1/START domain
MSAATPESSNPVKIEPVYMFWDTELLIQAPAKDVWPHLVDYKSWQTYSLLERVSGKPGEVGEVMRMRKDEKGFVFPTYYARTIKIEPGHRIVWKTFMDKGATDVDRFGIVDFRLYEKPDGTTLFRDHLIYEFLVPYRDESELDAFREQQNKNMETLFSVTRPKLKKLVEKRGS